MYVYTVLCTDINLTGKQRAERLKIRIKLD